jgi:hypothetical protein
MRILSSPKKWEDAPGVDFVDWCQREFSLPMKMENDARMALMGGRLHGDRIVGHDGGYEICKEFPNWRGNSMASTPRVWRQVLLYAAAVQ